jgi:tripartite-type tricarboxylate transporter receptor subunit TctC
MQRRDFLIGGSAAATQWPLRRALAQANPQGPPAAFPTRPIHIVVPSSAGGVHDVIARIWGDRVKSALGAVVVENRSGGGASIALNYVAQSQPDGYTLLLGSTSTLVLREGSSNRAYDAIKDITPATIMATTSTSIAVNPSLPVNSVKELIDYARAYPGKLAYGSAGVGAITHVTVERFKQQAGGLDMLHVPYKGVAPALNDLMSGEIGVVFPNITAKVIALHRSGKLRILAVNAPARLDAIADIPTAIEAGLPDFVSQTFFGVFAPASTAKRLLQRIDEATQKEWADAQFQAKLAGAGFEPMLGYGPARAEQYLAQEFARWNPIVQSLGTQNQ